MNIDEIKQREDHLMSNIERFWQLMVEGVKLRRSGQVQKSSYLLTRNLRSLGLYSYRFDGNMGRLVEYCYYSALNYKFCNLLISNGMPYIGDFYKLSKCRTFFDAIISMNRSELLALIEIMPNKLHASDDKHKFYFIKCLQEIIQSTESENSNFFQSLQNLQDLVDCGTEIDLCWGFIKKDEAILHDAISSYLDKRLNEIELNEDVISGEEGLSLEGMSFIKIAQLKGVNLTIEHSLIGNELLSADLDASSLKEKYSSKGLETNISKQLWE